MTKCNLQITFLKSNISLISNYSCDNNIYIITHVTIKYILKELHFKVKFRFVIKLFFTLFVMTMKHISEQCAFDPRIRRF